MNINFDSFQHEGYRYCLPIVNCEGCNLFIVKGYDFHNGKETECSSCFIRYLRGVCREVSTSLKIFPMLERNTNEGRDFIHVEYFLGKLLNRQIANGVPLESLLELLDFKDEIVKERFIDNYKKLNNGVQSNFKMKTSERYSCGFLNNLFEENIKLNKEKLEEYKEIKKQLEQLEQEKKNILENTGLTEGNKRNLSLRADEFFNHIQKADDITRIGSSIDSPFRFSADVVGAFPSIQPHIAPSIEELVENYDVDSDDEDSDDEDTTYFLDEDCEDVPF